MVGNMQYPKTIQTSLSVVAAAEKMSNLKFRLPTQKSVVTC